MRRGIGVALIVTALVAAFPPRSFAATTPLGHVFVVVLENTRYTNVTPASMPYLTSLGATGVSLGQMYGVDHASLTNYIAMASGHASNALTRADCFSYNCVYDPPDDGPSPVKRARVGGFRGSPIGFRIWRRCAMYASERTITGS